MILEQLIKYGFLFIILTNSVILYNHKEDNRNLQDNYDKLKEDYDQLLKDMESLKISKTSTQQNANTSILNTLNNTNIISKSNKKEFLEEEKNNESLIANSFVRQTIKKLDFELKNQENKNGIDKINNNINGIINNISHINRFTSFN